MRRNGKRRAGSQADWSAAQTNQDGLYQQAGVACLACLAYIQ